MKLTLFKDLGAAEKTEVELDGEALSRLLAGARALRKEALPLLSLQAFGDLPTGRNCLRWDGNVVESWGVAGDYDGEALGLEEAVEKLNRARIEAVVYSSPSYTPEKPRWRVLAWFSRPLAPGDQGRMMDRLNGALGGGLSPESWALSQGFFYGKVLRQGHSIVVESSEGEPVDLRQELDLIAIERPSRARAQSSDPFDLPAARARAQNGSGAGDHSRSGEAARIAAQQQFDSLPEMTAWLRAHPDPAIREYAEDDRQLERIWERMAGPRAEARRAAEDARAAALAADQAAGKNPYKTPHIREPRAFFDPFAQSTLPIWPAGLLPARVDDYVLELCEVNGTDFGAQALVVLQAVSAAAHKKSTFYPKGRKGTHPWHVRPILWTMIIAPSGMRKSALAMPFDPIRDRQAVEQRNWALAMAQWKSLPKAERSKTPPPPQPKPLFTNDTSYERLGVLLSESGRGVHLHRDELAGMLGFGRYAAKHNSTGASAERAFYLESYEGGAYMVTRMGRDDIFVDLCACSFYGTIQPERLAGFADLEEDGMLQRFAMAHVGAAQLGKVVAPSTLISDFSMRLGDILNARWRDHHTSQLGSDVIATVEEKSLELVHNEAFGPGIRGFWGKLQGLTARYALVLHILGDPKCENAIIPPDTIERAWFIVRDYLMPQAEHFFVGGPRQPFLHQVANWIINAKFTKFHVSQLVQHNVRLQRVALPEINRMMEPFVLGGWLKPKSPYPPANKSWTLSPGLREWITTHYT